MFFWFVSFLKRHTNTSFLFLMSNGVIISDVKINSFWSFRQDFISFKDTEFLNVIVTDNEWQNSIGILTQVAVMFIELSFNIFFVSLINFSSSDVTPFSFNLPINGIILLCILWKISLILWNIILWQI